MVLIVQSQCLFLNSQMQMAVKLTPIAYALTQQSGNERFRTLVAIFGCYLKVFSDEPLPQDISRYVERLGELPDSRGQGNAGLPAAVPGHPALRARRVPACPEIL